MALAVATDPTPLTTDDHGVVRVAGTRITLDLIVQPFLDGITPEEIALRYPSLGLADIYATIAYYLKHRESVDEYLAEQARLADESRERFAETVEMSDLRLVAHLDRHGSQLDR